MKEIDGDKETMETGNRGDQGSRSSRKAERKKKTLRCFNDEMRKGKPSSGKKN